MPAMVRADLPAVVDCGHAPAPTFYRAGSRVTVGAEVITMTGAEIMFPGYGTLPDGRRVCVDCAEETERGDMRTARRFTAYLSSDGRNVTTWTGGVLARVTRMTRNDRQTFIRARDSYGQSWAGIGPAESGTYVSLRRVK
jgi:hypothetical protein